jgi:hypothetical protein
MYYIFGDYVLDTQRHELHHAGEPIKLRRDVCTSPGPTAH